VKSGGISVGSLIVTGGSSFTGNVGVGTASPAAKLTISNNVATGFLDADAEYQIMTYDGATAAASYGMGIKSDTMVFNSGGGAFSFDDGGTVTRMLIDTSGNVTIGGSVTAGSFLYSSDRTLKKDVQTIADPLSKVSQLRGVTFTWKNDGRKDVGLIAQEVEKVIPEAVQTNPETGLKSVEYGNLVGVLIEAVKAQQVEINALKAEVKSLKK